MTSEKASLIKTEVKAEAFGLKRPDNEVLYRPGGLWSRCGDDINTHPTQKHTGKTADTLMHSDQMARGIQLKCSGLTN